MTIDPAAMVAAMSIMVLEGWKHRLSPQSSVLGSIESSLGRSPFGLANRIGSSISSISSHFDIK